MVWELILAILCGVSAGTITGILPGIHINLVASFLLASLASFTNTSPLALAIFIVAMSITHTFIDFIPSIYLGAPEEDTFLSILPGHELLKQGKGHEAVVLTLYGSLLALLGILLITPLYLAFLPALYLMIKSFIPYTLVFLSLYLILREEKILTGLITFSLAGILGLAAFHLPIKEPLMPLLTGLFGLSALIISYKEKPLIIKQSCAPISSIKLTKQEIVTSSLATILITPFFSFLPGIGAGHAATFISEITPQERRRFLFVTGAVNTLTMGLSFIAFYAIQKTRTGSAAALKLLLPEPTTAQLLLLLAAMACAGLAAFVIGIGLSKVCAMYLMRIPYQKLTLVTSILLIAITLMFSNLLGILLLLTATALGVFAITAQTRRINLMAALIVPAIVYYLIN